ncbi:hypothetical protein P9222_14295 [Paenibacillus amylolyticus]|nr:hypothetical protein [Paenibacillus amylolyticus]WFR65077.1 hypothetical protein P9222_14295 [Paenibacillus amylolyticus]
MTIPKKTSLFAMLIMIMLVAAACGDKADNTAATKEPAAAETTTGTDSEAANTEETDNTETASEEAKETDNSQDVELGTTEKDLIPTITLAYP